MSIDVVAIGASLGGIEALQQLLYELPGDFAAAVAVVLHRGANSGPHLCSMLAQHCRLPVVEAEAHMPLRGASVVVAPPGYHLLIEAEVCALSTEGQVNFARPSIDVLFESAAWRPAGRATAVMLTGSTADGAAGCAAIERAGGRVLVQDPATAASPTAPQAALRAVPRAFTGTPAALGRELARSARSTDVVSPRRRAV